MQNWWGNFKGWLSSPFSPEMSALHWFYFLGLLIVLTALWGIILKHLKEI